MSLCNNLPSTHNSQKRGRPKNAIVNRPNPEMSLASSSALLKRSNIVYLCERPVASTSTDRAVCDKNDQEIFYCSNNCGFGCTIINNIIGHRKFCLSDFGSRGSNKVVYDMAKRQRIRGETKNKEKELNGPSTDSQDCQPSCSSTGKRFKMEKERTDAEKKLGIAERDIMWVKRGKKYWPALVWEVRKHEVLFYVITSPDETQLLTMKSHSVKKNTHSFEDVDWSKKLLAGSKKTNDHSNFLKAVQKANSYNRKKVILDSRLDAKKFFDIKDENEFSLPSESEGSEMENEYSYESPTIVLTDKDDMDVEKVLDCISNGDCDDHVISIYLKKVPSERNEMFFSRTKEVKQRLEDMSWFGPFKTDATMQLTLYDHFYELYKNNIGVNLNVSYIYKVWIPEGIIKAISLVNSISCEEAELIFLRQETLDRVPYDPLEGTSPTSSLTEASHNSSLDTSQTLLEASLNSP